MCATADEVAEPESQGGEGEEAHGAASRLQIASSTAPITVMGSS